MALDKETIEELAAAPERTNTDEGTVKERSANDIIKLDNHATAKDTGMKVPWGMKVARIRPGGAV